jgi:DNA-binding NarL/FixJ family response regulator
VSIPGRAIRVVIVDDHGLLRAGLSKLLGEVPGMEVVGEAADGADAVAAVEKADADVVLMDLSMPGMDGVTATRQLREVRPETSVVMLTSFVDREKVQAAIAAGAVGYLLKDSEPDEIIAAIKAAARGESPLHPKAARALIAHADAPTANVTAGVPAAQLTAREREVLELLGRGLANKQIARQLGISERTVKTHLTRIYNALGVADRTAAILALHGHTT